MTGPPRPSRPPRAVAGCWAVSVTTGAFLLAINPAPPAREPAALSPYSLAAYLRRVAGPDARDVRVNSFYGSGRDGAWQFVAHLTWLDPNGSVRGGSTALPVLAGRASLQSTFDDARLQREQQVGWTAPELDRVLDQVDGVSDPLVMLELEIDADGSGEVVACAAPSEGPAACQTRSRNGDRTARFTSALTDTPTDGPLAIRRTAEANAQ